MWKRWQRVCAYGKIAFENIIAETVVGEVSEELLAQCNKILSQAIQE